MIRKGLTFRATFVLKSKDGAVSASGSPSASFGYKLGPDEPERADGVWVDWSWNNDRFQLKNDRLGFYPMFYRRDHDGFGVSNDIAELVQTGCSTELDDAAIAVYLRLGFYIGDDTPFKAIRAVPPGAVMSWDARGFRLEPGDLRFKSNGGSLSRSAAVKAYGEIFQTAVGRFITGENERVALPLSGGRDSRHILLALLKENRKPHACITVMPIPPKPDVDARVASEVTRSFGIDHVVLPQEKRLFGNELVRTRLTNFCADEHEWILPLRDYLQTLPFTSLFDGIGGGVLSAGAFLTEERLRLYEKGELRKLAEVILGPEAHLAEMIRPELYAKWSRPSAVDHLIAELERYRDRPDPVGQFYFWNRTRREISTSCWGILNESRHVFAPFLSRNVYDFLANLPASYFLDRSFHTEAIARYYPAHANLPYETKGKVLAPTRSAREHIAGYAWDAARYCGLFPGRSRKRFNAAYFIPRIAYGLLNPAYGARFPRVFNKAIYLTQLAEAGLRERERGEA